MTCPLSPPDRRGFRDASIGVRPSLAEAIGSTVGAKALDEFGLPYRAFKLDAPQQCAICVDVKIHALLLCRAHSAARALANFVSRHEPEATLSTAC